MDDSKPDTLAVTESDLTAAFRSGETGLPSRLHSAIASGAIISLQQDDGSHIYISTPVALEAHLARIRGADAPSRRH